MLRNYLLIAFRNIKKHKILSSLNILGLSLGISCVVFIYSFIDYELSFEKCYPKADRIYRVSRTSIEPTTTRYWAPTAPPLGPALKDYMPEIESFCRVFQIGNTTISLNDSVSMIRTFTEPDGFFADTSIFEMFTLEFIEGNPETAFKEQQVIVISESMAERFFPEESAIGKSLRIDNYGMDFIVTGVIKNVIGNTHLNLEFLVPMELLRQFLIMQNLEGLYNSVSWAGPYNYIMLKKNADLKTLEAKMPGFIVNFWKGYGEPEEILARNEYPFQAIKRIHLHSKLEQEIGPNSDMTYVYVFLSVAILILLIGGVNYVNISTAQSMRRIKEIGIRKVAGAHRAQIIRQYFGESFLIVFIASIFSVLFIDLLYPYFNRFSSLDYSLTQFFSLGNILLIIGIVVGLGFLAGLYPALLASGFSIEDNIKGAKKVGSFSHQLRKILIVLQFAISIFLIFSTLSIFKQLRLFNNNELGFTKENVIAVYSDSDLRNAMEKDYQTFKTDVQTNPQILSISSTSNLPGERTSVESLNFEGYTPEGGMPSLRFIMVDENYLETMQIELLEGDGFQINADTNIQFVINESCKEAIGLDNPIGCYATNIWSVRGKIVGVMNDHNFASLHEPIEPLVLSYADPGVSSKILFRYTGDKQEVVSYLEGKLKEYNPNHIFNYKFITDQWDSLYETEIKAGDTFGAFTLLAIIISCIGLFGLAAFTAESRMKEMGIRKIHGAGLLDISKAFGLSFIKLILVASVVATPLAWIVISTWIEGFEYQIEMSWLYVLYSLAIILAISFLTILYQMIKVHRESPLNHIKYE